MDGVSQVLGLAREAQDGEVEQYAVIDSCTFIRLKRTKYISNGDTARAKRHEPIPD